MNEQKNRETALRRMQTMKISPFGEIMIHARFRNRSYSLVLLTRECQQNMRLIRLLTTWRNNVQYWFPSQFKVTVSGTKLWFDKRLIQDPDRMLFIIKVGKRYIGHIGLDKFDFTDFSCEIDNVIRGESLYPGIMSAAMKSLMTWAKRELGVDANRLEVASDNAHAVKFYNRLGFREVKRVPMVHVKRSNMWEWIDAPAGHTKSIKRYNVFMKRKGKL